MSPKRVVQVCAIILLVAVVLVCGMNFNHQTDKDFIMTQYNNFTQNYNRVSVSSIVNAIDSSIDEPNLPGVPNTPIVNIDTSSWLSIVDGVHKQWGSAGFIYQLGGTRQFTEPSGNTLKVRIDCSGYVSYCLYVAGYSSSPSGYNSRSDFSSAGFNKVDKPVGGWTLDALVPGDIIVWKGSHVQIYAGPGDDWYNWGGHTSCEDKYVNITDINSVDSQMHGTSRSITNADIYRRTQF